MEQQDKPERTDRVQHYRRWRETRVKIIGGFVARGAAALLLAACGSGPRPPAGSSPAPDQSGQKLPYERLLALEAWGASPGDTTVAFLPGQARTVVIRHGPPDNTVFVEVHFLPESFPDSSGDSVRVHLGVLPGRYGVTLATSPRLGPGTTITFKYPVHFGASQAARDRYGSAAAYERALSIFHLGQDGAYHQLPSRRPATDNLAAAVADTGLYLVAAPR